MTNQEIIDQINKWQNSKSIHPLTCGNNSRHENLVPKERDNKVVLACPDCDYIQEWIPEVVLRADLSKLKNGSKQKAD